MNIGFIGAGNMGSAVAKAVADAGFFCLIYDRHIEKAESTARICKGKVSTLEEIKNNTDFVFLGIKPQGLDISKDELTPYLDNKVVISMLAGKKCTDIESALNARVIRIMPNTPIFCNEGVVLYCVSESIGKEEESIFCNTMSRCGMLTRMDEGKIDAATAISGCGPAFVYTFIEALAQGGVECGLDYALSLNLATQTIIGSAKNLSIRKESPDKLTRDVCSPKGSTIEGVNHLKDNEFESIVKGAVNASFRRTQELGK